MIKKVLTYISGEVLVKGSSFLALPLYSYLILPSEYGTLGFLRSITSFLPFILTFYYLYAYVRLSVEVEEKKLLSTYFYLGIYLNIFYFSMSILLYYLFINRYDIEIQYFMLSILSSAVIYMYQILQMYYRSKGLAKQYIKVSVLYALFGLGSNFILLYFLEDNVLAMLVSSFIVALSASVLAYIIIRKDISFTLFDISIVKKILRYSTPLVPGAIALLVYSNSDKIILINYITKDQLGIYTFAFTVSMAMSYIGNAFFMSYQPIFYKKLSESLSSDIRDEYWKYISIVLVALFLAYMIIFVIYQTVNNKYIEGLPIALTIATAYSFITFAQIMELHLTYVKKTHLVSIVYAIGGIITVTLLLTLIPQYSIYGAAIALLISAISISILMYFFAQHNLYIAYNKLVTIGFYSSILLMYGAVYAIV